MKATIKLNKSNCCSLSNPAQKAIMNIPGVYGVTVNSFENTAEVEFTSETNLAIIKQLLIEQNIMEEDKFKDKAQNWDSPKKIEMANKFVQFIQKNSLFNKELDIIEAGCGTGLIGLNFVNQVNQLTMIDNSPSMLMVLEEKLFEQNLMNVTVIEGTIDDYIGNQVDKIIIFMALHHINNIDRFIDRCYETIRPGGELIIGDLLEEDGSFHYPEKVAHNGFNLSDLNQELKRKEFKILKSEIFSSISKNNREYPQFVIIAHKN